MSFLLSPLPRKKAEESRSFKKVQTFKSRKGYCNLLVWHTMHTHSHIKHTDFSLNQIKALLFESLGLRDKKKPISFSDFTFPGQPFWYINLPERLYREYLQPDMGTWMSYHRTRSGVHFCINNCSYPMENVSQLTFREKKSCHPWQHSFPVHTLVSPIHISQEDFKK